ncbi:MAG: YqgE/AlgH family protein [Marinifilaceae bacterium]
MDKNSDFFRIEHNNVEPEKGRILIAEPFLQGRYFKRSIVLLAEYSDEGAVGFVLNKPIHLTLSEVLVDFPVFEAEVYVGGPVDTNRIYFIHTLSHLIPQSLHIKDNLYWGGDFEALRKLIEQKRIHTSQIRFFAGYSGWDAGQLSHELKENSWMVSSLDIPTIMNVEKPNVWEESLRQLGGKYRIWSNYPENPSLN